MHTFGILITLQENKTILHIYNEGSVAGNVSKSECCKYMTILIFFCCGGKHGAWVTVM